MISLAWCLLAVISFDRAFRGARQTPLLWRFAALTAYILGIVFLLRPLLRRLLPTSTTPSLGRFGAVMILLLLSVWATEALGVHSSLFGALLAGIVMPKEDKLEEELRGRLESITLVLLLPLFFAYTGLRTSIGLPNSVELWLLCGLIVMIAMGSKLLVSAVIVRASGMPWRESLAVGVLVNTRGLWS